MVEVEVEVQAVVLHKAVETLCRRPRRRRFVLGLGVFLLRLGNTMGVPRN